MSYPNVIKIVNIRCIPETQSKKISLRFFLNKRLKADTTSLPSPPVGDLAECYQSCVFLGAKILCFRGPFVAAAR